jgi:hypothetical protein
MHPDARDCHPIQAPTTRAAPEAPVIRWADDAIVVETVCAGG